MRTKRFLLGAGLIGLVLAAGCGPAHFSKNREESRQRWDQSRTEMVTRLAEGCYQRGEVGRARQHVDEGLKAGVPYAPLYILAARLASDRGQLDEAACFARNAKTAAPKSAEACYVLGTIEQTLGHVDRAAEEFTEAARLDPSGARYVMAEAELLVTQGHPEQAARRLSESVPKMPGRPEIHAALGDVLSLLKRYDEAAGSYRVAIRLDPKQAGLKERLATALYRAGAYGEAEAMFADLAGLQGQSAPGWMVRTWADCLMALGRTAEARALYAGQAKSLPESAAPLVGLAKCDILGGRLPEARTSLEAALAKQPQHPEANALMGYVLMEAGQPGEAVSHLRLALQDPRCEGRPTVERLLAQAERRTGVKPSAAPAPGAAAPAGSGGSWSEFMVPARPVNSS